MSEHNQKPRRRRHRHPPGGDSQVDDGVDRGDGRTSFGTFSDGHSGNGAGRPRGSLNAATIIRQELVETVVMKTADGSRNTSLYAAAVKRLARAGLVHGNIRALERIIALGLALEEKPEAAKAELPIDASDRAVLALLAKRQAQRAGSVADVAGESGDA